MRGQTDTEWIETPEPGWTPVPHAVLEKSFVSGNRSGHRLSVTYEAMGGAAWMQRHHAVADGLATRFKTMLPINNRCIVRTRVVTVDERKVRVPGTLAGCDDTIYAEAEALFVTLDPAKFGALAAEASRLFGDLDGDS